ncbi:MAG: PaaI family thioesterase [Rhodospirillaceae bacterium]|jgi:acyl-coenzyme A thioesterase PaaI-like protein|nr:PaaI family thioesterase [Rhodospirillaceae bacterium]MBT4042576.1 PaaI family thioesterase [Rhodospirillaceae bacterium]MBT4687176.1 PaaI family thioesterase [Rhodospirillaceae bacterium]MBT5083566.1 PaaI family thioesterase [Rhodospirillaceae bacterium]MBT5525710.1 PaaI family thioesterase [Rhodospirillaceae bacterium]
MNLQAPDLPGDITSDIPDGFQPFVHNGRFADCIGPFYAKALPEGGFRYLFKTAAMHANPNDVTHGGALYSFADHITGHAVVNATHRGCATIKFKVEYLSPVPLGTLVEGTVELVRITRTMAFLRLRLFAGDLTLMTADGAYKLFAPFDPAMFDPLNPGLGKEEPAQGTEVLPELPEGFQPFPSQGSFPALCGPTHYRRDKDGGFMNGFQARQMHDNTNNIVHGGVLFTFADDIMGRASSGITRRMSTTIALNVEYLAPAPLDAWIEGATEITYMDDRFAFVRSRIFHGDRILLTADGVWRLLQPHSYSKKTEAAK